MAGHPIPKIVYGLIPTTINFDYPPSEGRKREEINRVGKASESLSGVRQFQLNYLEGTRKLKFSFVSETIIDQLEAFFENHAALGKSFKFYQDKTSINYVLYEIDQSKLSPVETHPKGIDTYLYDVELAFRRAINQVSGDYMEILILNNQVAAIDLTGVVLDSTQYRSVKIFYEIFRKTATNELLANGELVCLYDETSNAWSLAPGFWEGAADYGVVFSITPAGQVQYTSSNLAGANYTGRILLREFTIIGG
jgi:hypothetical protein